MCSFDKIPYHYIGELEVPADADYISEKIGAPRAFNRDTAAYKYSEPVVYECTAETVELVGKIYKLDLDYLGYNLDQARESCTLYGTTS